MNAADLPKFTIISTEETAEGWKLHGEFNHMDTVQESGCWLFTPWQDAAWEGHGQIQGDTEGLDRDTLRATIVTTELPPDGTATLSWLQEWWNPWQIAMITDLNRAWERIVFAATDGFAHPMPDGWRELKKATGLPEADQTRVADAWNHEHCEICWHAIESGEIGYHDGGFYWLCAACFEAYARTHNISFVRGAEDTAFAPMKQG